MYRGEIVEHGSVGAVLANPRHSHTQELVLATEMKKPAAAEASTDVTAVGSQTAQRTGND